jgi:hypothetical protein
VLLVWETKKPPKKSRIEDRVVASPVVDENPQTISFNQPFSATPILFPQMQTFNGPDTAEIRIPSLSSSSFKVFVEEEKSLDAEVDHTTETIGYLAFDEGDITDSTGKVIGEAGKFSSVYQTNRGTWFTLTLRHTYVKPAVVMMLNTYNGPDPAHIRMKTVTSNSFQYQVEEFDYTDGAHTNEDIAYVVVESGSYLMDGNKRLQAQTITTDHSWKAYTFANAYSKTPVVISQCLTLNGGQPAVTRQKDISTSGGSVRLQEQEAADNIHMVETIAIISMGDK